MDLTPTQLAVAGLRDPEQDGMGRVFGGKGASATDRLSALDKYADSYRTWSPVLISGLLQTSRYTAGAIKLQTPSLSDEEIARRVQHRVQRTANFLGHWAGRQGTFAWFVMGEAAITQPVCDTHTHGHQLMRLLSIARNYPQLVIQVLPDHASAPSTTEPFSWFALEDGQRVGYLETAVGGWYTTAPQDSTRLHSIFSEMIGEAYTPAGSREFIQEVLETCWGHTAEQSSSSPRTAIPRTASTLHGPRPEPLA